MANLLLSVCEFADVKIGDFPTLEGGNTNTMNLFIEIKNLEDEQEDVAKQVRRLAKNLNTDVDLLKDKIYNGDEEDIKDMVDQIQELKKRLTSLLNLSDKEPPLEIVIVTGNTPFECSISEFFSRFRRKLLKKKDEVQDLKRHQENLKKTVLQETLKIFPKVKIMPLENRRVFYP